MSQLCKNTFIWAFGDIADRIGILLKHGSATCVGIGRPFLYGLACYGQQGVEKVMSIFRNELEICMQMMGTPTLRDIKKNMLVYKNIDDHITVVPPNVNALNTYTPMKQVVQFNSKL
eukprot:335073_1